MSIGIRTFTNNLNPCTMTLTTNSVIVNAIKGRIGEIISPSD